MRRELRSWPPLRHNSRADKGGSAGKLSAAVCRRAPAKKKGKTAQGKKAALLRGQDAERKLALERCAQKPIPAEGEGKQTQINKKNPNKSHKKPENTDCAKPYTTTTLRYACGPLPSDLHKESSPTCHPHYCTRPTQTAAAPPAPPALYPPRSREESLSQPALGCAAACKGSMTRQVCAGPPRGWVWCCLSERRHCRGLLESSKGIRINGDNAEDGVLGGAVEMGNVMVVNKMIQAAYCKKKLLY